MTIRRRNLLTWSAGVALGCALPPSLAQAKGQNQMALVVARNSPIEQLSPFELKKLYLGAHITDSSGERIVPLNHQSRSPDRVAFDREVLGLTPDEAASYWIDRKIRGQSGAPTSLSSAELLQRVVSKVEHSIAYVRLDQVSDAVRVLAVLGEPSASSALQVLLGRAGLLGLLGI